jgi:OmpA-OmpF porin, OOP family
MAAEAGGALPKTKHYMSKNHLLSRGSGCTWLFVTSLLWFSLPLAWAQPNLVPNPSFENHRGLPTEIGQFNLAHPWNTYAPGNQPADYFHRNSNRPRTSLPVNFIGTQEARTGDAYAGILLYMNAKEEYSEFIQVQLTEPLQAGRTYYTEMYVSLADNSRFAIDGLDMFVSERAPLLFQGAYAEYTPQVRNPVKEIISEKEEWVKISGTFEAKGGERVLTIGNFRPRAKTTAKRVKSAVNHKDPYDYAYYYVDDIKLALADGPDPADEPVVAQAEEKPAYFSKEELHKPVILKNVVFEVDKSTLLPESVGELQELKAFLQENQHLIIFLTGHTDNTHTPAYNRQLSEDRVLAVKNWLVENGIRPDRLRTKGYGDTQPIADNQTVEGRQRNRRVEFSVLNQMPGGR